MNKEKQNTGGCVMNSKDSIAVVYGKDNFCLGGDYNSVMFYGKGYADINELPSNTSKGEPVWTRDEVVKVLKEFISDTRGDKPWVDADDEWTVKNL